MIGKNSWESLNTSTFTLTFSLNHFLCIKPITNFFHSTIKYISKQLILFLQNMLDSAFWDNKINVHKRIDMSVIKLMDLQMLVFTECLPTACVRTLNQDRKHTIHKKLNINQSTKSTDRYFYVTIYDMLVGSTNQFNFFIKMQQLNERDRHCQ